MLDGRLDEAAFAIVDVETTGIDARSDRVVEVACVVVRGGRETQSFSSLIDPGKPIPPRASAIHHLTDAVVQGQPTLDAVSPILSALCADAVVVAHNAIFDLAFLPMLGNRPSLCTLRLARHCFPELDGHANQLLRYVLDTRPHGVDAPHRALDDARVTAAILQVLLRRYRERGGEDRVHSLLIHASSPIVLERLPFGEHRGKPLREVPTAYLRWIRRREAAFDRDVQDSVAAELTRRSSLQCTQVAL